MVEVHVVSWVLIEVSVQVVGTPPGAEEVSTSVLVSVSVSVETITLVLFEPAVAV